MEWIRDRLSYETYSRYGKVRRSENTSGAIVMRLRYTLNEDACYRRYRSFRCTPKRFEERSLSLLRFAHPREETNYRRVRPYRSCFVSLVSRHSIMLPSTRERQNFFIVQILSRMTQIFLWYFSNKCRYIFSQKIIGKKTSYLLAIFVRISFRARLEFLRSLGAAARFEDKIRLVSHLQPIADRSFSLFFRGAIKSAVKWKPFLILSRGFMEGYSIRHVHRSNNAPNKDFVYFQVFLSIDLEGTNTDIGFSPFLEYPLFYLLRKLVVEKSSCSR